MRYVFFDCEGANSFNGVNKICSFGYVLTDANFKIIQKKDLVMNPEAPFDYYLFKKKSRIKLAYEKEFFRKQENFVYYYDQIKFLLEQPDLVIFGYSISNDIRYLHDACNRYNLPLILFNGYDAQELLNILKKHDQSIGLEKAITDFNIDLSHQIAHRSDEDAFKTMRIVQEMCNLMEMDVKQLIEIADLKALSSIQEKKENYSYRLRLK